MSDIAIDLQVSDAWKIQLIIANNFLSSKDTEEERVINSKNNNIKLLCCNDANKVVNGLFDSLNSRYQGSLETWTTESEYIFHSVQLMY